jgi:predicted TIM-barrel fold metal-dependent hydrolase
VSGSDAPVRRFDSLVHITASGRWINDRDDASIGRLQRELDAAGVDRACLVGLPGVNDHDEIEHAARASDGRFVPIAGIDPTAFHDDDERRAQLAALQRRGFRGIKLHPRLNDYHPLHPRAVAMVRAAAEQRLVVFLDTLFRQRRRATGGAADLIDRLVHRCPATRLVLLHGGGADVLRVAEVVRVQPQLLLDVSYTLLAYKQSSVHADLRHVFERLDQRVVMGSDMPEFTPADAFAEAEQVAAGLPREKWLNIAAGNLTRLFAEP